VKRAGSTRRRRKMVKENVDKDQLHESSSDQTKTDDAHAQKTDDDDVDARPPQSSVEQFTATEGTDTSVLPHSNQHQDAKQVVKLSNDNNAGKYTSLSDGTGTTTQTVQEPSGSGFVDASAHGDDLFAEVPSKPDSENLDFETKEKSEGPATGNLQKDSGLCLNLWRLNTL